MRFRSLDLNGDWTFGKGNANYLQETDAIAANIKTRLSCFLNDCFFDSDFGIDWFTLLGSKNQGALALSINSIISQTTGVSTIKQLSASVDENRNFAVSYEVTTVFGTGITEGAFSAPVTPYSGISKFVSDIIFNNDTTFDADVSADIIDARTAVWILYDVSNGYTPVLGAVQPLSATTVRISIVPAVTGTFRLVGIA